MSQTTHYLVGKWVYLLTTGQPLAWFFQAFLADKLRITSVHQSLFQRVSLGKNTGQLPLAIGQLLLSASRLAQGIVLSLGLEFYCR